MLDRRSFLAVIAGAAAAGAAVSRAEAAPVAAQAQSAVNTPTTVAGLRESLSAAPAAEPREMQYYYRRYYYRRPVYVYRRRPRLVRRCFWSGYGRVCRVYRVW